MNTKQASATVAAVKGFLTWTVTAASSTTYLDAGELRAAASGVQTLSDNQIAKIGARAMALHAGAAAGRGSGASSLPRPAGSAFSRAGT